MDVGHILNKIETQGDTKQARIHQRYHKSEIRFYGWKMPDLRQLAAEILRQTDDRDAFFGLCEALWTKPVFETRTLVSILFERRIKQFFSDSDFERFLPLFRICDGWALTDNLAIKGLGEFLIRYPQFHDAVDDWRNDCHLWVRRAGILRFITPVRHNEHWPERMEGILKHHFAEEDFFIRKAIGWTLREWSKRNPEKVWAFAHYYKPEMAPLTFKEATRNIKKSS